MTPAALEQAGILFDRIRDEWISFRQGGFNVPWRDVEEDRREEFAKALGLDAGGNRDPLGEWLGKSPGHRAMTVKAPSAFYVELYEYGLFRCLGVGASRAEAEAAAMNELMARGGK